MDEVEIFTNWTCENKDKLKNLVSYIQSDNKTCDIEHITPETCICLEKEENDYSNSKPEININVKHSINEIRLYSEGSLIEVFGVQNEYLFTCFPEFVDDWEGMAVYYAKIVLPSVNECKLKFPRIKDTKRLWIYNVQLSIKKIEEPSNNLFNFENVNKLISNSSQEISEKAKKFKKFFELYAKNSKSQPYNVQTLLSIINKECNSQLSDCRKAVLECLNSSSPLICNEDLTTRKENNEVSRMELSLECQYLMGYIDRKFNEMRQDFMKCIEIKLNELRNENNAKLDHIIKLLKSSSM